MGEWKTMNMFAEEKKNISIATVDQTTGPSFPAVHSQCNQPITQGSPLVSQQKVFRDSPITIKTNSY